MANIILQHEGATYRTLGYTGRVTSPSLVLEGDDQTLYTPLFAVASGAEGRDGNYYYKCCPLAVQAGGTTYRAAYQRRYADSFSRTISGTISHSNKTVTIEHPTGIVVFEKRFKVGYSVGPGGGWTDSIDLTIDFTRDNKGNALPWQFITAPVYLESHVGAAGASQSYRTVLDWTATSCTFRVKVFADNSSTGSTASGTLDCVLYVDVAGTYGETTYPDETKSVTASGDFNYGHTYGSAPSLSADNGVSVSNNSGNASFHASKTLSGTVSYGKSKTLSQAFNVSFTGAA